MSVDKAKLIKMAYAPRPHGIKGEVELKLLNPNLEESILEEGMSVWAFPASEKSSVNQAGEEWVIKRLGFGNKVIAYFEGVTDRTQLEKLLPFEIYLDRESFPEADDDEVYLVDLIDMPVFSPENVKIGVLESFSDNGMQYLFDVRLENGEKITLPYVDAFFPEIDVENKKITMIMPEYSE